MSVLTKRRSSQAVESRQCSLQISPGCLKYFVMGQIVSVGKGVDLVVGMGTAMRGEKKNISKVF